MSLKLITLGVLIIGAIALIVQKVHITYKECTCEIPKNEIMYNTVDDKGNVIKQVSKSELKQLH